MARTITTPFAEIAGLGGARIYPAASVPAQDGLLGYKRAGEGAAKLIILHDWSVSSDGDYAAMAPFLDGAALDVVFADVRGYGASYDLEGAYTETEIANDVRALADRLGWSSFSIAGHSMTGFAVQKIVAAMPERLVKAIAVTPAPASGVPADEAGVSFFESVPFDDDAFTAVMGMLTSEAYGPGWAGLKLMQNRSSVRPEAMKAYVSMFTGAGFAEELTGVQTPLLAIFGSLDLPDLRKEALEPLLKQWFPNLTTEELPVGHYPMLEEPTRFAHLIESYLTS